MKKLFDYINEALIKKDTKISTYNYFPKNKDELRSLLEQLLEKRKKDADLNDIDTSAIIDMSYLFNRLDPHNIDISEWDLSNVEYMSYMFYDCKNFNSDLSRWDVSKVEDMKYMFHECKKFNSDLSGWNVKNVAYMDRMLGGCTSLKNKPAWYKE